MGCPVRGLVWQLLAELDCPDRFFALGEPLIQGRAGGKQSLPF